MKKKVGSISAADGAKPRAKRMTPEARQEQILNAGISAFAERGLANATHADIAERIGVSIPTIFHYFPSIENLQQAVLQVIHRYFVDEMIIVRLKTEGPAYERIENLLLTFQEQIDQHSEYVTIWLEWSGFTRGLIWQLYLDFYKEAVAGLRKMLLQGRVDNSVSATINASDAARVIMGMAHTIAHMRFAGSSKRTVENTVHSLVMSYLAPDH
ncbi:TetR/AcrR family transcriptional regulator [Zhongshania sp.]|uniref:TetR/AcrR family transcriptional regulator n=1 Tax=Zhongshania sp. TaxID=1971902 RepID=UPI003568CA78